MKSVQLIEYIKYFTLKGSRIGFNGDTPKDIRITEEEIITPEGHYFYIENFLIDNYLYTFDKDSADFEKRNITFDLFLDKSNVEKLMIPNLVVQYESGGDKFRVYIFNSTFYKTLPENIRIQNSNLYGAVSYMESYGSWTFPYSLIITIKDVGASFADFELFLNMNYNAWKNDFNAAIQKASSTDKDFKDLIKYPIDVFERELDINTRIALIEILAYNEIWDLMGWGIDFDGLNEQDFVLQLIESTPDKDAYTLYLKIFDEGSKLFRTLDNKFDDEGIYKMNVFLIKHFYKNLSKEKIEIIKNEARSKSLDEKKIIPIMTTVVGAYEYGATPIIEYTDLSVKIKFVLIQSLDNDGYRWIKGYDDTSNPYYNLQGQYYDYDEMLYALCMFTKLKEGIMAGQIIPLPAFAIKGINKILSEEYTIKNLLLDIGFSVGFIMPFFGLAEEISALVINRWSVVNNGVAILFSFGDSLLGGFLKKYLENTLEGRQFLKIYNYVTFMYGLKDAKGAFPLYENFKSMGKLSSADYEFLLSAYGTYSKTDDFKELKKINEGQYKRIENELNKISEYYDEIIK